MLMRGVSAKLRQESASLIVDTSSDSTAPLVLQRAQLYYVSGRTQSKIFLDRKMDTGLDSSNTWGYF